MNASPRLMSETELNKVYGGFAWWEIPHLVMGTIEFFNYSAHRLEHGCNYYEEKDYLSKYICKCIN